MTDTFYYCSVGDDCKSCSCMNECKRYVRIKNLTFEERQELGMAKLYNICNENNGFKLFMKEEENVHENL